MDIMPLMSTRYCISCLGWVGALCNRCRILTCLSLSCLALPVARQLSVDKGACEDTDDHTRDVVEDKDAVLDKAAA